MVMADEYLKLKEKQLTKWKSEDVKCDIVKFMTEIYDFHVTTAKTRYDPYTEIRSGHCFCIIRALKSLC